MNDVKGAGSRMANGSDPFADLVRAVEGGPGQSAPAGRAYSGFEPVEVPQSQWDTFTYRPASVTASAPVVTVDDRIAPLGSTGVSARSSLAADADLQIDEALRGLSQPARPRDTNPAETQSFAPAREPEFETEHRPSVTLDDFDELIASELAAMRPTSPSMQDDDYGLGFEEADAELEHEVYDDYPVATRSRLRRPLFLAGVAALALVGVVGAASFVGVPGVTGGDDGSLLIKADAEPYKIAPADPGGRSIPNQNKAVYQKVAGLASPDQPTQQSLVTAMEEPLEIAEEEDQPPVEALPGVEVGDQIALPGDEPEAASSAEPKAADADMTLQPRKVRTLTVRPDGTLVAGEAPAPAVTEQSLLTASAMTSQAAVMDPVAGIQPTMPFSSDQPDMTTASTRPSSPGPDEPAASPPEPAPTAPVEVAAVEPAPVTPSPDGYFVQIASQPSEGAAKESMANLGRRYASVIGGRGLGIKSAEIPGKGTFYRVRVAAASKSEANSLCESLKSAGGSCFVTR